MKNSPSTLEERDNTSIQLVDTAPNQTDRTNISTRREFLSTILGVAVGAVVATNSTNVEAQLDEGFSNPFDTEEEPVKKAKPAATKPTTHHNGGRGGGSVRGSKDKKGEIDEKAIKAMEKKIEERFEKIEKKFRKEKEKAVEEAVKKAKEDQILRDRALTYTADAASATAVGISLWNRREVSMALRRIFNQLRAFRR